MKAILFYPMMFLRPFLKVVLRLIGGLMMLAALVVLVGSGFGKALPLIITAFVVFMIGWAYDSILLKLNPEDNVLFVDR